MPLHPAAHAGPRATKCAVDEAEGVLISPSGSRWAGPCEWGKPQRADRFRFNREFAGCKSFARRFLGVSSSCGRGGVTTPAVAVAGARFYHAPRNAELAPFFGMRKCRRRPATNAKQATHRKDFSSRIAVSDEGRNRVAQVWRLAFSRSGKGCRTPAPRIRPRVRGTSRKTPRWEGFC